MSPTTLLRSSGRMSNPSLIIIHSLKHSANDFWTEASVCTYCLCTMLSTDTLLPTISLKLQLYCRIQGNTFCPRHDMLRPYESHARQQSISLLSHELHIFVQTLSYDNRSHQKLAGTRKILAVHNSECYMVNSKSYEHLRSMRDKSLSASCFADSTVHSHND